LQNGGEFWLWIYFSTDKSWTGSTRGEPGRARAVHRGPTAAWTEGAGARRRSHRSTASGRSGALKLIGGSAIERGEHGELSSGLTGARVAAWRPGDGGAEPEVAALSGSKARAWREAKRGWERCGEVRGWCSPFIGVGGAPGRGGRGLTPALMALTPLKTGGGGGVKRGIKGGK
jgi:hypothetical protein